MGGVEVSHMNIHSPSAAPSCAAEEEVLPLTPTHYHGNKAEGKHNRTKVITAHAYQTMFVIAACAVAVACKATQVDAFSASNMLPTRINSSSSSSSIPTKSSSSLGPSSSSQSSSLLFKYPAFTSNEYKSTAGTGTALFASSRSGTKTKKKSDEAEWNALLSAFQMYKAAYGDLKVPSRFVVPAMPPWPGE